MKTFKFYDQTQNQKVKDLLSHLNIDFEIDENDLIKFEDSIEYLLDDVTCLVRTLKFSQHKWYILHLPQIDEYKQENERLYNFLKEKNIDYLKEINEGEVWITLCDSIEIPKEIYKETED